MEPAGYRQVVRTMVRTQKSDVRLCGEAGGNQDEGEEGHGVFQILGHISKVDGFSQLLFNWNFLRRVREYYVV